VREILDLERYWLQPMELKDVKWNLLKFLKISMDFSSKVVESAMGIEEIGANDEGKGKNHPMWMF
jgi:hypothetical protein